MEKITEYLIQSTVETSEVRAWEETVMLPTYATGKEEKNPVFLEKRVYQASSGVVYPYPVIESISDEKVDKPYRAVFIENEYIKVMILPELGGRIHMAYDKVKARHFVYYNQVVKPALVGLTGPWISGGIEFNWPQHHRPTTFMATDFTIEEFEDGSKTIWCSEVERMFRTKGMAGFTLYPGKSYIEIKAKVYNRTAMPQTFLWWANPAVVVHDDYFSVFPPDVHAVFDHGKRDVSSFPIATGTYYKQDYSAGVDISRYKNIPVPTSYMAVNSKYDFVGGYEDNVQAGLLHVAEHHTSTGKKQWTWGNGDFGKAWDRNLTDEDGPYIELMTGMYCDNQPDFTWLQPYEEKTWKQYFMPYSEVGMVKNATKDTVMGFDIVDGSLNFRLYTSSIKKDLRVIVKHNNEILIDNTINSSPAEPYTTSCKVGEINKYDVTISILDSSNKEILSFKEDEPEIKPIPDPAAAAKEPKDIHSIEQLFLTGHHLEQYRHATYNPMDYYLEALRREPGDIRCNNAVGLLLMRRGKFAEAKGYFDTAIATQTSRNPNPYDGEPYFNLGWAKKMLGDLDGAYDSFFKSAWNAAMQDAAYFSIAQIDMVRGDYEHALDSINRSLNRNYTNLRARQIKASTLRKLERYSEALRFIEESLLLDKFNMGCRYEKYLILKAQGDEAAAQASKEELTALMRGETHATIDYALDFAHCGEYAAAEELLQGIIAQGNKYPMTYYAVGYFNTLAGNRERAKEYYTLAETMPADCCFPNKLEELLMLQDAAATLESAPRANHYLGNIWYGFRQYEDAKEAWENSTKADGSLPTTWRNLALYYYNKLDDKQKAKDAMERAFSLDTTDSRILMELDQLYKKMQVPHSTRLELLEKHSALVEERDDLCIERITLYNQLCKYDEAKKLIESRHFHPWEGGEGKITGQYSICHLGLAQKAMASKDFNTAIELLTAVQTYPHNLGEGKLTGAEENDVFFHLGECYRALGNEEAATENYLKATIGSDEPAIAYFYNDQQPHQLFYQGLAWRALGEETKAMSRFQKLIKHGEKHLFDTVKLDYFAVSLPDLLIWEDDLNKRSSIHCNMVMGLGNLGVGNKEKAQQFFSKVLEMDINHQVVAMIQL